MVCATAEELQARLALRSLFSSQRTSAKESATKLEEEAAPGNSSFHQSLRAEVDDVLKAGLTRRLERLERKVNNLLDSDGAASKTKTSDVQSAAPSKPRDVQEATIQTEDVELPAHKRLAEAFEKALIQSTAAARPTVKRYEPSRIQKRLQDPPEKDERIERETTTLQATSSCLRGNVQSRERQIASLKEQLRHCEKLYNDQVAVVEDSKAHLAELQRNPSHAAILHNKAVDKRRNRISEMRAALDKARDQRTRHQALAVQQRMYLCQNETVSLRGGTDALKWHKAGEVFLEQAPAPLGDEKLENWDVGTAIANPYVVDSWPFEPNVMARRVFKCEPSLSGCKEETEQDLKNEERRLPGLNLRLPLPGGRGNDSDDDDDDFDDRYQGPSETSRSL